jgi:hypothetical protein
MRNDLSDHFKKLWVIAEGSRLRGKSGTSNASCVAMVQTNPIDQPTTMLIHPIV